MRRLAAVTVAWGLVVLVLAPAAVAFEPVASVTPGEGPPGTEVTVIVSGFLAGVPLEVHEGDADGPLLGTGLANASGLAGIPITIPADAATGDYDIYVCGSCSSEFFDEATTVFAVTVVATTTTTTTTSTSTTTTTTTTTTVPPVTAPCEIPDGARVIDFDAWSRELGDGTEMTSALQQAVWEAGHPLLFRQWSRYQLRADPPTDDDPSILISPRVDSDGFVADNPAGGLTTSSPPNVMRLIDDTAWSIVPQWVPNLSVPSYVGFNVGFGHFGDGFETPDELVVELRVRYQPMEMPDGSTLDQGAWETVSVTLGPGPQPVQFCMRADDTVPGAPHPHSVLLIDIVPLTVDGTPVHIPVDVDDVFYGIDGWSPALEFDGEFVPPPDDPTVPDAPVVTTATTLSDIGDPPPDPSDWPLRIVFTIVGVILGGGVAIAAMRQ